MTHNIHHISELPPLYEVERRPTVKKLPARQFQGGARLQGWKRGEYKKAKMKRCV
jgi:hypothetical protein